MPYIPQQSPSGIDSEGVRSFAENEFRNIARSWTELEVALVSAGIISPGTGSGGAGGGVAVRGVQKNYVINGAMTISQQNGATAGGLAASFFPVDMFFVNATTTGTGTCQQVASVTPTGSPNRIRVTCTATDFTIAAADFLTIVHRVEGYRMVNLRQGTTSAKTVTLQFGVKAPTGTYCVGFRNNAINRSYVAEYTIAPGEASVDVVKTITVPLDTIGTWEATTLIGLNITWALMAGSTAQQAAGVWIGTVANTFATVNQFNFMGTTAPNNVFELFDVSLTEGSAAPPFVVPDYATELMFCQRYYETGGAYASAATGNYANIAYQVTKRAPAAVTFTFAFTGLALNASGTYGFHFTTTSGITGFNYAANARL